MTNDAANDEALRVVCLCAGWCGVCREYRATFDAAAAAFATRVGTRAVFSWFDIEDEAALLDDVDVENFPTVLIARGEDLLFFGPITPQSGTLARLVQRALEGELKQITDAPEADAFVRRLRAISL